MDLTRERSERLRGFLDELDGWQTEDLALHIAERRQALHRPSPEVVNGESVSDAVCRTLNGIINGQTRMSADLCSEIAGYFDKPPEDLYVALEHDERKSAASSGSVQPSVTRPKAKRGRRSKNVDPALLTQQAEILDHLMQEKGLNNSQLAQILSDMTGTQKHGWESRFGQYRRGRLYMEGVFLTQVAQALDVSAEELQPGSTASLAQPEVHASERVSASWHTSTAEAHAQEERQSEPRETRSRRRKSAARRGRRPVAASAGRQTEIRLTVDYDNILALFDRGSEVTVERVEGDDVIVRVERRMKKSHFFKLL